MAEYILYDVTVETYSPLHIGSGEVLLKDYDYAVYDGRTWRLNLDVFFEERGTDEQTIKRLSMVPPARLLRPQDYVEGSPLFHYVLRGEPRSQEAGAQLQEQIKDAWHRPYLPGSSLKGALRTALLWEAVRRGGERIAAGDLGENPKRAALRIEQKFLGADPNHDLLRALQVGDSAPLGAEALMLANAQVIGGRTQQGAPIKVEAIRPRTAFHLRLKVDTALFGEWAAHHGLRLKGQALLEDLPGIVQRFSQGRLQATLKWYEQRNLPRLAQFCHGMMNPKEPNECFLQIGWAGGWDSKTLGATLQKDPALWAEILRRYRLGRGRRDPQAPFPATRRMAMGQDESPSAPFGWVKLTFVRREG